MHFLKHVTNRTYAKSVFLVFSQRMVVVIEGKSLFAVVIYI